MAARKSVLNPAPRRPELEAMLAASIAAGVSDEVLAEQQESFAYGNAPEGSRITKDSVRLASRALRLVPAPQAESGDRIAIPAPQRCEVTWSPYDDRFLI